jgi:hypothetical protein
VRYRCIDCGVNVVAIGEFYMLKSALWEDQLGLGLSDNLCIGCLERRLGRKISLRDLGSFPRYRWMQPLSLRMQHRIIGDLITKRPPYRLLKYADVGGYSKADVQAIGEFAAKEEAAGQPVRQRRSKRRHVVKT